ncbi:hypothetical protein MG290_00660 [Flavobacterium sp. CBA20B-1]|uniref:hypothetical protein n=1 Tax=unclassified Flavobacterium TaxID=196869 RepID=UPI00222480E2|nr:MULTISPECIES: hypothetical protein [unclassified Flavobacterium]WCM42214.1 hypothetical protein MG290_00660 [Flavobacterium sp. CBA20B-1]
MSFLKAIVFLLMPFWTAKIIAQENDTSFIAEKWLPENYTIAHQPIKTKLWNIENVVIVFYETPVYRQYKNITYTHNKVRGFLLVPYKNTYKMVLIDAYEDDNVATEILSVFFANIDNDKEKELIVLTANDHRLQYLYEGRDYGIYFYDNFENNTIPNQLKAIYRKDLERFQGDFEGFKAEQEWKAQFKNADAIKKELKKMGF